MHTYQNIEVSPQPEKKGRPRFTTPFPLQRPGRAHLSAIRGAAADGAMPPEALAAVRKALQWLCCAQDAKAADDRLGCLQEAETALQSVGLDFRAVLGSVEQ